jgi:hypothetical protein
VFVVSENIFNKLVKKKKKKKQERKKKEIERCVHLLLIFFFDGGGGKMAKLPPILSLSLSSFSFSLIPCCFYIYSYLL